jgi:hypothetical protein
MTAPYNSAAGEKKQIPSLRYGMTNMQNKAATFAGRGSVDFADAPNNDLLLSIQRCARTQLIRSPPVVAGIGKVAGLERTHIHPDRETTPGPIWLQGGY